MANDDKKVDRWSGQVMQVPGGIPGGPPPPVPLTEKPQAEEAEDPVKPDSA